MKVPLYEEPQISTGIDKYDSNNPTALLTISDIDGTDIGGELFVLNFGGGVAPNYQIMYSLGDAAYLNVFNQRLSSWTLDGIFVPAKRCTKPGTTSQGTPNEPPGFYKMYEKYNIASPDNNPVKLTFSGLVVEAYIIAMNIPSFSKSDVSQMRFSLQLLGRIKKNGGAG